MCDMFCGPDRLDVYCRAFELLFNVAHGIQWLIDRSLDQQVAEPTPLIESVTDWACLAVIKPKLR